MYPPPRQTVCYSHLPSSRNEDGLVVLQFKKPDSQLLSQQDSLAIALQALITTPGVQLVVDSVRPLPDNWSVHSVCDCVLLVGCLYHAKCLECFIGDGLYQ